MKKTLKTFIVLIFAVMFPIAVLLTACGATTTDGAYAVHFVSDIYDEETGYAVFEVDKDVPTKLEYKVNPSTWGKYDVTYTYPEDSVDNKLRYLLVDGVITVNSDQFQQIQVKIHLNGKTDNCLIRLKEYPTRIFAEESSVKINSNGVYTITAMGEFKKGSTTETRILSEHIYNFVVESSDETILKVPDSTRLTVYSLRNHYAEETVKVTLCDTVWKTKMVGTGEHAKELSFEVDFEVVQNASFGYLALDCAGAFVYDGSEITVNLADLEVDPESGKRKITVSMFVESSDNKYLKATPNCASSNSKRITIGDDGSTIFVDDELTSDLSVVISSWTSIVDDDGNAFSITFKLNLKA